MHKRITALDVLRARRCGCSCSPATTSRVRYASHAAAFAEDDMNGNMHGNGNSSNLGNGQAAGPQRARRARPAADYRFPEKGKRGGPPDPYEILALERGATGAEIKAAYYALALVLHPDSSHPSASAEHFALLNKAYKLLSTQAGRSSYLATGYGWTGTFDAGYTESSTDAAMRDVIRRARSAGAAEWGGRGFRDSDAGRGAWTYRTRENFHPYTGEEFPTGGGEELYMSNNKFVALIAALAGIVCVAQIIRFESVSGSARDLLIDRHIHASKALEEARREAAMFGKERREQLRRRVRENSVMEEIEKMERGEWTGHSSAGHRTAIVPAANSGHVGGPAPSAADNAAH